MEFNDWITQKYIEWRGNAIGQDRSITEFALMLKVPQSLMTQWMKNKGGKRPTSQKYISVLVSKYGVEAYDILGIPRPSVTDVLSQLSSEEADAVVHAIAEIKSSGLYKTNSDNANATASPDDVKKINDILEKHLGKYHAAD